MDRDYSFPYEPYPIQRQLMDIFYAALEERKVAILESPTGTGKSLSTICAAMTWLEANANAEQAEIDRQIRDLSEQIRKADLDDDWMNAHGRKLEYQSQLADVESKAEYRKRIDERLQKAKLNARTSKQKSIFPVSSKRKQTDEPLDDDDDVPIRKGKAKADIDIDLLPTECIDKAGSNNDENDEDIKDNEEQERLRCPKIIYASRTHSQLDQFATELLKTRFRPRVLTVGSRQLLCVNDAVRALRSSALINDRCNELLNSKSTSKGKRAKGIDGKSVAASSSKCGCEYTKSDAIEDLTDQILSHIPGNDSLPKTSGEPWLLDAGKKSTACPYFAARNASSLCELILVPYNILLHKATRDTWNLDLKNNVVIVDEAHNLLQILASIHSCELDEQRLASCCSLIADYIEQFAARLSPRNLLYIRHLKTLANRLLAVMRDLFTGNGTDPFSSSSTTRNEMVYTLPRFMAMLDCTDIDIFKLIDYLETSNLCRKLRDFNLRYTPNVAVHAKENHGTVKVKPSNAPKASRFANFLQKPKNTTTVNKVTATKTPEIKTAPKSKSTPDTAQPKSSTPLYQLKEFLEALITRAEDARILIQKPSSTLESGRYRFLLLNPAEKLKEIVSEARSLVLIGGTMKPVDQLMDAFERVCGVSRERIVQFSCGHVIDDSQLVALSVARGPSKMELSLSFSQRNTEAMAEIGRAFVNMLRHVPNGVVAFFPSYAFLSDFIGAMKSGPGFQQLNDIKPIFMETRGSNTATKSDSSNALQNSVWLKFRAAATIGHGALLLAVIGGSLSEGINFSDELGRCVIVVGLPYANKNSLELQERMKYIDEKIGNDAGARLYESLCIHAVNQAIGRAIRHRNDHAAIILLDSRYLRKNISEQLPAWIRGRSVQCEMFHEALAKLISFFKVKK